MAHLKEMINFSGCRKMSIYVCFLAFLKILIFNPSFPNKLLKIRVICFFFSLNLVFDLLLLTEKDSCIIVLL